MNDIREEHHSGIFASAVRSPCRRAAGRSGGYHTNIEPMRLVKGILEKFLPGKLKFCNFRAKFPTGRKALFEFGGREDRVARWWLQGRWRKATICPTFRAST